MTKEARVCSGKKSLSNFSYICLKFSKLAREKLKEGKSAAALWIHGIQARYVVLDSQCRGRDREVLKGDIDSSLLPRFPGCRD